jgi:CheY-like chemotaxis protein
MDNLPTLLPVEDEPLIRAALTAALEDGGYILVEAENGAGAMRLLDAHPSLSVVVTDIRLGFGPDGWEVARQARRCQPLIAVVYMTGDSAGDWSADGVPNSILLQKPFATAQLTTAISTLLNSADVSPVQAKPVPS